MSLNDDTSRKHLRSTLLSDDELRMQLLVDGQLDHSERSQWLLSIPEDSDQWRLIALRFVENQILDESLGESFIHQKAVGMVHLKPKPVTMTNLRSGFWWIAIAASLLFGMGIGMLFDSLADHRAVELAKKPINATAELANSGVPNESHRPKVIDDVLRLPLEDALARSIRPVSLDTHRAFLKAGYFVEESSELANVELPTGNSVKMPVRQIKIRYLGNAAFQ